MTTSDYELGSGSWADSIYRAGQFEGAIGILYKLLNQLMTTEVKLDRVTVCRALNLAVAYLEDLRREHAAWPQELEPF